MPIKLASATEGDNKENKERKKSKRLYRTSENIRIINLFLESLLSVSFAPFLTGSQSPPLFPGMPSSTVLASGPAVGAAQILLLCVLASNAHSYQNECIFSCGSSQGPFTHSTDTELPGHRVDLICSFYSCWEGFGSSSLATLPLGFNYGFISTSACVSSTGVRS